MTGPAARVPPVPPGSDLFLTPATPATPLTPATPGTWRVRLTDGFRDPGGPARPGPAAVLFALLRRDAGEGQLLRWPLVLDICFGVVNLAVFLVVSQWVAVGGPAGRGQSVFAFVAVGVSFMLVVQVAGAQVTGRLREEQRSGTLEAVLAAGAAPWAVGLGSALYPALVGSLRCVLYLGGAALFLGLPVGHARWAGVFSLLVLGGLIASAVATLLGAVTIAVRQGSTVCRVALAVLGLVSGAFVPVAQLPGPLPLFGAVLPTRPVLDGLRAALAGDDWAPDAWSVAGWVVCLLPAAAAAFAGALHLARRRGTVSDA